MDITYKSTKYAACSINKSRTHFLDVAARLNLEPKNINLLFLWTDEQIKMISSYKKVNPRIFIIPEEQKQEIIQYFRTEKNNTVKQLAQKFQLSESRINAVIDEYFENLKKQKKVKTNK